MMRRGFGLCFRSEIALPELPAGGAAADVTIRRGRVAVPASGDAALFGDGEALFAWRAVGRFRVRPDEIVVDASADVSDELIAFPLLGPVLATLLHLRGLFVLHASAVTTRPSNGSGKDGAIVLLGHKGAGKSSTAAALVAAGHRLLADDIVALRDAPDGPVLLGGIAQMKLSRAALEALDPPGLRRGDVHPAIDKVRLHLAVEEGGLADGEGGPPAGEGAYPLARLCTVERGTREERELRTEALAPHDGFASLLAFSYMARFGERGVGDRERHLAACAALAARPGVSRLVVPSGLGALRDAARAFAPIDPSAAGRRAA